MEKKDFGRIAGNIIDSDFSKMEGTNCYCSEESIAAIRRKIGRLPLNAIHRIGTGDYHYVSLFWLEKITEPFVLFLFDNHPDDQDDAFGTGMLSCGSWVKEARKLANCAASLWYDGNGCRHESGTVGTCKKAYVSIDLDILSKEYARTDWNQGSMTLEELKELLEGIKTQYEIIGIDLCGGITPEKGASSADISINATTEEVLINMFLD